MKARVAIAIAACLLSTMRAAGVDASDRYRSPRNPERKIRKTTELIVLHTTEAAERGSLNKLSERGECHFCVTESGTIYRIVDRDREAFHAGRSMWNGKEDVDKFSIGIECVGHHDKAMPVVQLKAIRDLVKDLKAMYAIPDDRVVCHSHVAYGAPNKWQKKKHRGRKRCGMRFAMPSVRKVLELKKRPRSDADVKAKRLVVGDEYLNGVLYGKTDTMKKSYDFKAIAAEKAATSNDKKGSVVEKWIGKIKKKAAQSEPDAKRPSAKKSTVDAKPAKAKAAPKKPAVKKPASKKSVDKKQSAFRTLPTSVADLKARGYVKRGEVTKSRTALKIVGSKWNSSDTYYTIRDKVIPGNMVNASKMEVGMGVWTR